MDMCLHEKSHLEADAAKHALNCRGGGDLRATVARPHAAGNASAGSICIHGTKACFGPSGMDTFRAADYAKAREIEKEQNSAVRARAAKRAALCRIGTDSANRGLATTGIADRGR